MTSKHIDIWYNVDARLYTLQTLVSATLDCLLRERDIERLENNALVVFSEQPLIDSLENSGLLLSVFITGISCLLLDESAKKDIHDGFYDTAMECWPSILVKICEILETRYNFQYSFMDHQKCKTIVHQLADKAFEILQKTNNADNNVHMLQFIAGTNEIHCECVWSRLNPERDIIKTIADIVDRTDMHAVE